MPIKTCAHRPTRVHIKLGTDRQYDCTSKRSPGALLRWSGATCASVRGDLSGVTRPLPDCPTAPGLLSGFCSAAWVGLRHPPTPHRGDAVTSARDSHRQGSQETFTQHHAISSHNRVGGSLGGSSRFPLSQHRASSLYSAVSSRLQRGVMGLEADEPKLRKKLQCHSFVGGRTARPTPPSLARECQRPCLACRHPALHEEVRGCLDTFALLEAHAAKVRRSRSWISLSALLQAVWRKYVTQPVVKLFSSATIRSSDIPRLRRVIRRSRSLARSRLFGETEPPAGQKTAEEGPLHHGSDGALRPIDLEAELAFEESHDRGHHPLSRRLRPHVDVAVVNVAAQRWPRRSNSLPRLAATQLPSARDSYHQGSQGTFTPSINAMPGTPTTEAGDWPGLRCRRDQLPFLAPLPSGLRYCCLKTMMHPALVVSPFLVVLLPQSLAPFPVKSPAGSPEY
jgi:hypothetical protein